MNTKSCHFSIRCLLLACVLMICTPIYSQMPFFRTGQAFAIAQDVQELHRFLVQPSYNSTNSIPIGALPPGGFEAIGFRRTDNLIYGVRTADNHVFSIGQDGVFQDLGSVGLDNSLNYLAGDVSPDGRYLFTVGSNAAGVDVQLAKTDLETAGFPTQFVPLIAGGRFADIAFDPGTGVLYGFDEISFRMATINVSTGAQTPLVKVEDGNRFYGVYFDAFGDMYALGSTLYGIVDGFFQVDKVTGKETRLTTGPSSLVSDMASCPYSIEMKCDVNPPKNLPCSDIEFTYTIANNTGETFSGIEFLHALPSDFHLVGVLQNTFGALLDTTSIPGALHMPNIALSSGIRTLKVKVHVGDIPQDRYLSQPKLSNLPPLYGLAAPSDYVREPGFEDSTVFIVNRFDKDSLDFAWIICHGSSLVLDGSDYGNTLLWNTGSANQTLTVTTGGLYSFVAGTTCENVVVRHDVTSASCPFTISVFHTFEPDTSFACSDLIFRFILRNDSGEPRYHLSLKDTLPLGFTFVETVSNTVGGTLQPGLPPGIFWLRDFDLNEGADTLDVRVHAGDIPPGVYKNRAVLFGLPVIMGPIRLSDDPRTFQVDSSRIVIQGALSDSLFLDELVCRNAATKLDATTLGKSFLWDNGSTEPVISVNTPGIYHLQLFDGCEPADVFWNVGKGKAIEVESIGPFAIHQGETLAFDPFIANQGDSLFIHWTDPLGNSLSCVDCPSPVTTPLQSVVYGLKASNEECSDSSTIWVDVDEIRRIYAPTAFSPNDDGENDYFFLMSPDFGKIHTLAIYDRWGNMVFHCQETLIGSENARWDGRNFGKTLPPGLLIWYGDVEFVDGKRQKMTGEINLIR